MADENEPSLCQNIGSSDVSMCCLGEEGGCGVRKLSGILTISALLNSLHLAKHNTVGSMTAALPKNIPQKGGFFVRHLS